jgi:hypothetical protein
MSVIEWDELSGGRDGDVESGKKQTIRRHTRVFRAKTDNNYDDDEIVKAYGECPRVGHAHPNDSGSWCRKVKASNDSFSHRHWLVTAIYSSEFEIAEDPQVDPADIDWDAQLFQRPYFVDNEGKAIVNSAGDYPDPPLEGDDAVWVVSVRKNFSAVPTWILTYKNAVNTSAFVLDGVTIAARQAKISGIRISTKQERNGVPYRAVAIVFHLKDDGDTWDKKWLDQGLNEKDPSDSTKRRKITDVNGAYVTSPAMLDGSGAKLSDPKPDTAVFNTDKLYPEKDFSVLPLT